MIQNMAYLVLVSVLIGLAALLGERVCAERNGPRRTVWLSALVASIALPAYTLLFSAATTTSTPIVSLPLLFDTLPMVDGIDSAAFAAGTVPSYAFSWPAWQAFDSTLIWLWAGSSTSLLVLYGLALLRVRRILSEALPRRIGEHDVLLSDRLGPAVLGFLKPRIVLPHWLAERDASFRALVIRHEREHIAARDQLSLLAALLLVATMPWNLALWWQFRRLRTAIEFDCDRRVLGTGVNPRAYSQALLTVGSQAPRTPFAAVALTEPASVLEQRIRGMLVQARNLSLAACGARLLLAVGTIGLAFAVNAPKAQQAAEVPEGDAPPSSSTQTTDMRFIPALRLVISDQFNAANECLQRRDTDCAFGILDEINEMSDLNVYEAGQLQNFYAFANFEVDNFAGAASAYETILALPRAQLPPGLVASTMRNLATLYLQFDRLQDGLDMYQGYLALPFVTPGVSDHFLLAQLHYQLEQYSEALSAIEQAIAASPEPQRVHYELLLGIQSATGDETGLAATRETLAANWPDTSSDDARVPPESQNAFPGMRFGISDGEYLPIVKVAPTYPPSAAAQGLEGYVIVEYTVTATGSTEDVRVVEGSSSIFDAAAVESAQKYKYMPRVIDGTPVAVPGVRTRIEFVLDSATGA